MPSQVANIDYTNYRYGWHGWHYMCQCCYRYQIAVHATLLYGCTAVPYKVKLWNQQHVLFCSFTIKETNFVLILVVHSLQFSEVAAATTNMTDLSRHEWLWLSHINMTDSDLTKYDWRRRLGDDGSGDYIRCLKSMNVYMHSFRHNTTDREMSRSRCAC